MTERICEWCGLPYYPKHGNQKYCCDDHAKEGERENSRIRKQKYRERWRTLYGHQMKNKNPKGTGSLGASPDDNFYNEWLNIQKEKRRLGLV